MPKRLVSGSDRSIEELEVLVQPATSPASAPETLLFVHAVSHAAWCWELFQPYFAQRGYSSAAVSLRGHGGSPANGRFNRLSLDDYATDVEAVIKRIDGPVVVVGHSMGGAIAQKLLSRPWHTLAGAVLISSAPAGSINLQSWIDIAPRLRGSVRSTFQLLRHGQVDATEAAGLPFFSHRLDSAALARYAPLLGKESQRAVLDLHRRYVRAAPTARPVMVVGSSADALFPGPAARRLAKEWGVEAVVLEDQCHDMMLDPEWETTAEVVATFLVSRV